MNRASKFDSREVEVSPDGRYFEEKLGSGAYKEVFLCYDTETGKEVAWNTVNLSRLPLHEKKRIVMETEILASLHHPHIINFYHVWENPQLEQICFTTEIVTSGTLKEYTNRVKNIKLKVIKKWCRQILGGLDYLHSHTPPIIHRDLKCDNIFINGSNSEVRIGDFGLSVARHATHVESVLGTPEFMSMELYDENYTELVDIYAFGMCVLEMITKEYPYEECNNAAQIWKKVSSGQKPEVLSRIRDPHVKLFVELCLSSASLRLSARELLQHPFLAFKRSHPGRDNIVVTVEHRVLKGEREKEREREREKEKEERKERTQKERERERDRELERERGMEREREIEREIEREKEAMNALTHPLTPQQQQQLVSSSPSPIPNTHILPSVVPSLYGSGIATPSPHSRPASMIPQQQQQLQHQLHLSTQQQPPHLQRTPSGGTISQIHAVPSMSPHGSPPATPTLLQHSASHPNLSAAHMNARQGQGQQQQPHMMGGPQYSHHQSSTLQQPHYVHPTSQQQQQQQHVVHTHGGGHGSIKNGPVLQHSHSSVTASSISQQQHQLSRPGSAISTQHPHLQRAPSPGNPPSSGEPSPTPGIGGVSLPSPLTPAPLSDPPIVSSVQVDIESTVNHIAHVILHLHFENRKKKQIKFDFDFRNDTSTSIASEMCKALKLQNNDRVSTLIAHSIESKVEPHRKAYFDQMRMESNTPSAMSQQQQMLTPHTSGHQTVHPSSQQQQQQQVHLHAPSGTTVSNMSHSASHPHLQHDHTHGVQHPYSNGTMPAGTGGGLKRSTSLHPAQQHSATLPGPLGSHHSYTGAQPLHTSLSGHHLTAGNSPGVPSGPPPGHRREHSQPSGTLASASIPQQQQPQAQSVHAHTPGPPNAAHHPSQQTQANLSRSSTPHTSGHHPKGHPPALSTNMAPQLSPHPYPLVKTASAGPLNTHHGHQHSLSMSAQPSGPLQQPQQQQQQQHTLPPSHSHGSQQPSHSSSSPTGHPVSPQPVSSHAQQPQSTLKMPGVVRKTSQQQPLQQQPLQQHQQSQSQQHHHHAASTGSAVFPSSQRGTATQYGGLNSPSYVSTSSPVVSPTSSATYEGDPNAGQYGHTTFEPQHSATGVTLAPFTNITAHVQPQSHYPPAAPHHTTHASQSQLQPHSALAAPTDGITSITEEKEETDYGDMKEGSPAHHPHPPHPFAQQQPHQQHAAGSHAQYPQQQQQQHTHSLPHSPVDTSPTASPVHESEAYNHLYNRYKNYTVTALKEQVRLLATHSNTMNPTSLPSSSLPSGHVAATHIPPERDSEEIHTLLRGLVEKNDLIDLAIRLTPREQSAHPQQQQQQQQLSQTPSPTDGRSIRRSAEENRRSNEYRPNAQPYQQQTHPSQSHPQHPHYHDQTHGELYDSTPSSSGVSYHTHPTNAPKAFTFAQQTAQHYHTLPAAASAAYMQPSPPNPSGTYVSGSPTGSSHNSSASSSPTIRPSQPYTPQTGPPVHHAPSQTQHSASPPPFSASDRFTLISPATSEHSSTSMDGAEEQQSHSHNLLDAAVSSSVDHLFDTQHGHTPSHPHPQAYPAAQPGLSRPASSNSGGGHTGGGGGHGHGTGFKDINGVSHSTSLDELSTMNKAHYTTPADMTAFDPLFVEDHPEAVQHHQYNPTNSGSSATTTATTGSSKKSNSQ